MAAQQGEIRQLQQALGQMQVVNLNRGRVVLGMVQDGIFALVQAARSGNADAQNELRQLRALLADLMKVDPRESIAVVRKVE